MTELADSTVPILVPGISWPEFGPLAYKQRKGLKYWFDVLEEL